MPSWADIKHHLPRIRLADSAIGAGLGAGAGALTYAMRDKEEEPSLAGHVLAGGLLGVGAGNLAGDRARRYLANNISPAGYDASATAKSLMPKSLSHLWRTAVQDLPAEHLQGQAGPHPAQTPLVMDARRELFRRDMGLPVRPANALWRSLGQQSFEPQKAVPSTHSGWNQQSGSGGRPGTYETVDFAPQGALAESFSTPGGSSDAGISAMQQALKLRYLAEQSSPRDRQWSAASRVGDPLAPLLGTHGETFDGSKANVKDLWDFALSDDENDQLKTYAKWMLTDRDKLKQPAPDYPAKSNTFSQRWDKVHGSGPEFSQGSVHNPVMDRTEQTSVPSAWQHFKTLLQRKVLNNLLLYNGGVAVNQSFDVNRDHQVPTWNKMSYKQGQAAGTLLVSNNNQGAV